jgi:hypothetical protein
MMMLKLYHRGRHTPYDAGTGKMTCFSRAFSWSSRLATKLNVSGIPPPLLPTALRENDEESVGLRFDQG